MCATPAKQDYEASCYDVMTCHFYFIESVRKTVRKRSKKAPLAWERKTRSQRGKCILNMRFKVQKMFLPERHSKKDKTAPKLEHSFSSFRKRTEKTPSFP